MSMIEIMNLRNHKPSQPYDFRIDRCSILGNPYHMKTESDRDDVCDKYQGYFDCMMTVPGGPFYRKIQEILAAYNLHGRVRLFCWCAHRRCHGETIKNWLETEVRV